MSMKTYLMECAWYCALALGAAPVWAAGADLPDAPAPDAVTAARLRPAVASRTAAQSVMLGAALAGTRIVAVGERGLIVLSDDSGQHWRQAAVPTSVTLTAVRFADARHGVAVGHAGVVLTSADGGAHWRAVLDGQRIAALALAAAKARNDAAALRDAERLAADGADKPLLDVCLLGDGRLLAVGAYGLAFGSDDGGQTWRSWMDRIDNPKGLHLNAVRRRGDTILIGGERGLALLSGDGGRTFRRLDVPYQGSFFTAELPPAGHDELVLAGLRGNAWRSADGGRSWQQLAAPMPVSITASVVRADGSLLFANQAGLLLTMRDRALVPTAAAHPLPPLNGVLELNNGQLLALTLQGMVPVAAPSAGGKP
ncbi:MAG: YCF48-related protein [Pseudomonadota bacterium]